MIDFLVVFLVVMAAIHHLIQVPSISVALNGIQTIEVSLETNKFFMQFMLGANLQYMY